MRFLGVRAERRYIDPSVREPGEPDRVGARFPISTGACCDDLLADDLDRLKERFGLSWP